MSATPDVVSGRGKWRRRAPWLAAIVLLLAVLFAPIVANDVPLAARVDGRWQFPAFHELVTTAPPGPGDTGWKQWYAQLPPNSPDLAFFPLLPYGLEEVDTDRMRAGPSLRHLLGNDDTGRDVLVRLLRGARTTLGLGLFGVLIAGIVGSLLGALAGSRGGIVDELVSRAVEAFASFPMLLLLFGVSACFGDSRLAVVVAFGATMWPSFARIVRGEVLSLREREFVRVARQLGVDETKIMTRHLLPQLRGQIGVVAAFCMRHAIVAESTLSFLGIGPGAQSGSWGSVLAQGKANAHLWVWHLWLFPGIAIAGSIYCCHAIADRLRPTDRG